MNENGDATIERREWQPFSDDVAVAHDNQNVRMNLEGSSSSEEEEECSPKPQKKRAPTSEKTPTTTTKKKPFLERKETPVPANEVVDGVTVVGSKKTLEETDGIHKQYYVANKRTGKFLYLICLGLNDQDGKALLDLEDEAMESCKKNLMPSRTELIKEVNRRGTYLVPRKGDPTPRPKGWNTEKLSKWLMEHPITSSSDVDYFKQECNKLVKLSKEKMAEARQLASGPWQGREPHLRLLMALIQDDIKPLYLRRADALSRQELDGRNSESRPKNVYELLSDLWNDKDFNPTTPASNCHEEFILELDCGFDTVKKKRPADAKKVQSIISTWRVDLLYIIRKWEQSGNGDGGIRVGEDGNIPEGFGSLDNRTPEALDLRGSFLGNKPPYYLLIWELMDKHQLLASSMQRINHEIAALNANQVADVLTSSATKTPRKKEAVEVTGLLNLATSIDNMVATESYVEERKELMDQKISLESKKREYEEKEFLAPSENVKAFYKKHIDLLNTEIEAISGKLAKLVKPSFSNPKI